MQNTAKQSDVLLKDELKNTKPVSTLNSQPLNQLSPLSQNEPESNNNKTSSSHEECKKASNGKRIQQKMLH